MAFSDFGYPDVIETFGLEERSTDLFAGVPPQHSARPVRMSSAVLRWRRWFTRRRRGANGSWPLCCSTCGSGAAGR